MNSFAERLGHWLGRWLTQPVQVYGTTLPTSLDLLADTLRPGDILLVEGNTRISIAIKYLTQSSWSHAALYVGERGARQSGDSRGPYCFVETDIVDGVRLVGLSEYEGLSCRICRPVNLTEQDGARVIDYALSRVGHKYDLKNVFDLLRYLIPAPPVPQRWRRRMLAIGSGDPTRAICSTLVAQCFQSVRYPILPIVERKAANRADCPKCIDEILRIRHHSLFVPRDFDVSPYFQVIKPELEQQFDYRQLNWADKVLTET